MHRVVYLGTLLAATWVLGCASPRLNVPLYSTASAISAPERTETLHAKRLTGVPFFADDTNQCGPASLASVLNYWGIPSDPVMLRNEIYLPKLRGSLPIDLLLAAESRNMKVKMYSGSLADMKSELGAGHPLLVFLNLGYGVFAQGHYVVVTGYDDSRQGVYLHSGLEHDLFLSYERFLRSWRKTG
ncbi:MAG: C39 family peptidase, partial [Nitrososphaerales archaeon]